MSLKIKEIFYSLQGEGGRQGEASIFIRLSDCNLNCEFCDTDFSGGKMMDLQEILNIIRSFPCSWIVWTGGEPTLQLSSEIVSFFKKEGYFQAIESNGTRKLPTGLDYISISPKGNYSSLISINPQVDEIRLPVKAGQAIPDIADFPSAKNYFLSPIFSSEETETHENIEYCVQFIRQHPQWRLSLQIHKLIGIE